MNAVGLLLGLVLPPVYLLVLGHQFRDNSAREKSIFWGTTIGWLIAILVVTATLVAEPVLWSATGVRTAVVFWGLLTGALAGGAIGAVRPLGTPAADPQAAESAGD